jgi:hypothetical protein
MALSQDNIAGVDLSEFYKLFHGAEEISGSGESFEKAKEHILSSSSTEEAVRKIVACIVFMEKPTKYLLQGKSQKEDKGGQVVESPISTYLPKHANIPVGKTPEEDMEIQTKRNSYPAAFQKVNFTAVRNVAYMALEAQYKLASTPICRQTVQWIASYGGPPSICLPTLAAKYGTESETYKIKYAQISKFNTNSTHWRPHIDAIIEHLRQKSKP